MTQNPDTRASTPTSLAGLRAGAEVGGYRLVRRLGAGGMGVVWEVADGSGHHVAMKILHPQIAADPMARRRLDREASVLARVKDTRVARILDIETGDGADGSGVTFVITELVDGPTLQYEVDHEGVYDLNTDARDLADLAHGLIDALSAVHDAGVIHRDLKPSNVMLGAQGPVLIDFGIAQVADDVRLTQTGQVTGTPGFIPPEMLDGDEPSAGVDWYACAGVLLFAVTGRAPFGSGPWQAVFRRVYAGTPELGDLEEERPALARAFKAALAPVQEDRLPIEDLLSVLDEIAEGGSGEKALAEARAGDLVDEAARDTGTFGLGYGMAAEAPPASSAPPGAYGYLAAPSAGSSSSSAASGPAASGPAASGPAAGPSAYAGSPTGSAGAGRPTDGGARIPPSFTPSARSGSSAHEPLTAQSASAAVSGQDARPTTGPGRHAAPAQSAPVPQPGQVPQPVQRPGMAGQHSVPPVQRPPAGPQGTGQHPGRPPVAGQHAAPVQSAPVPQPGQVPQPVQRPGVAGQHSVPPVQRPPAGPQGTGQHPMPTGQPPQRSGPTELDSPPAGPAMERAKLPEWAQAPRRHTGVIAAVTMLCLSLSLVIPIWVAIAATLVMVMAGTVGRAEDALRWRRLQAGHVSPSDRSRMWAAMPWYFLRSVVGTFMAALLSFGFTSIVFYFGVQVMGWGNDPTRRFLGSLPDYHRTGIFMFVIIGVYLCLTWFMPWAASTRRGGARVVEAVLGGASGRLIGVVVMLAIALAVILLFAMTVLPVVNLQPLSGLIS